MKAAVLHNPNDLRVEEVPTPLAPNLNEVIIKVEYAAICGTDLHAYRGAIPVKTPVVLGHEYVGRILQTGRGVRGLKIGDRVTGSYAATCGSCRYCTMGKPQLCEYRILFGLNYDGALAQFMRVPQADRTLVKLPDDLNFREGVLIPDTFLTALYSVERSGISPGSTILVMGLGAIGLCIVITSKLAGATVIAVDTRGETIKMAKDLGADYTIDAGQEKEIVDRVRKLTEGLGVDVAFGLRGNPSVMASALEAVKPFGKYLQVAIAIKPVELALSYVTSLEKTVIGVLNPASTIYLNRAIKVVKNNHINLSKLITHEFALDDVGKAFETADKKVEGSIKIIVKTA